MNPLLNHTDQNLIDYVFIDIAGGKIRSCVPDFSDIARWQQVVNSLSKPAALVYRIGIFNSQVINGGFIQYFDNGYGVFAFDTLDDLKTIKAELTHKLLESSLAIINPKGLVGNDFISLISSQVYDNEIVQNKLSQLDDLYYLLDDNKENLQELVAKYVRENIDSLN